MSDQDLISKLVLEMLAKKIAEDAKKSQKDSFNDWAVERYRQNPHLKPGQ